MPKIDIGAVLRQKAPRLARWIPRPVVNWLRRTIHESEINHILEHYWSLPPQEFIRACFREWQVTYSIEGLDKLAPGGRYLFASNHPFGGMDGMMLADKLIDRFGDARGPAPCGFGRRGRRTSTDALRRRPERSAAARRRPFSGS